MGLKDSQDWFVVVLCTITYLKFINQAVVLVSEIHQAFNFDASHFCSLMRNFIFTLMIGSLKDKKKKIKNRMLLKTFASLNLIMLAFYLYLCVLSIYNLLEGR